MTTESAEYATWADFERVALRVGTVAAPERAVPDGSPLC